MCAKAVDLYVVVETLRVLVRRGILTEKEAKMCAAQFAIENGIEVIFAL